MKFLAILSLGFFMCSLASADWLEEAAADAKLVADSFKRLDEVTHLVVETPTPLFEQMIRKIRVAEERTRRLAEIIPTGKYAEMCPPFTQIYRDLDTIRADLIELHIDSDPKVEWQWERLVHHYKRELSPWLLFCYE